MTVVSIIIIVIVTGGFLAQYCLKNEKTAQKQASNEQESYENFNFDDV